MAKQVNIGNKRPENHKEYTKLVSGGINADDNYEIGGVINQDKYLRGRNIRVSSKSNAMGVESIGGEREIYRYAEDNERYICILELNVNLHKVTIWASIDWSETTPTNGIMAIDDTIMLSSEKFPVRHLYPFDADKNENCLGGEIYITDNNLPPMYFNIQDIIDNFYNGTDKYFDLFDYKDYTINSLMPLNSLVFTGLKDTNGQSGQPVGLYAYSYRAVSNNGERTNWSIPTPLVIVPKNIEHPSQTGVFKYQSTKCSDSDSEQRTRYAPILKLRIDNYSNYDYIELKRTSYNNGEGYGYKPQSYIVQKINLYNNQFEVIEIIDSKENETDNIVIAEEDDVLNIASIIKRAEAIRYFKNKVLLFNIEYENTSQETVNLEYKEIDGEIANPILKFLGKKGHKDAISSCYYRSNMSGEKESYSIVLWDENMQKVYSIPIEQLKNYKFPDKRKNTDGYTMSVQNSEYINAIDDTINNVTPGAFFQLPSQDTNTVEDVFEVVLHTNIDIESRIEDTKEINILNEFGLKYSPNTPVKDSDNRYDGRRVIGSTNVSTEGYLQVDYNPDGFQPIYQSLGLSLYGISNFPEWCKAFSIVKTKPAGRVIGQGLAIYPLEEKGQTREVTTNPSAPYFTIDVSENEPTDSKTDSSENVYGLDYDGLRSGLSVRQAIKSSTKKVHVHIPDYESGIISEEKIGALIENPSLFKLQFIEPLGFFSDVFHGDTACGSSGVSHYSASQKTSTSHKIDMCTFAVCQDEKNMSGSMVGLNDGGIYTSDYAYFGGSRGMRGDLSTALSGWLGQSPSSNGFKSSIVSVKKITENNSNYLEIEVEDDVWRKQYINDFYQRHYTQEEVKLFHEHVYIVNIIDESAEVADSSIVEYNSPINYIKLKSKIGMCSNLDKQEFEVVDERKEDYKVVKESSDINFVYIERNGQVFNFINITEIETYFPSHITTIDYDIDNNDTSYCGKNIHGKYKTSGNKVIISTDFSYTPATLSQYKIRTNDIVIIKYNSDYPISIFGGEILHNSAVFTYKDRQCATGGIAELGWGSISSPTINYLSLDAFNGQFMLGLGFPFYSYYPNQNIKKCWIKDASTHYGFIGNDSGIEIKQNKLEFIRQWIWLYTCQARTNLSYIYGDFYPNISYVERPLTWDDSKTIEENHIHPEYVDDYTEGEKALWVFGGFRTNQLREKNINISTQPEHYKIYSNKAFLQNNNFKYCTRVVWSQTRPIQNYNSPNIKTFRPFNYKDISDKFGDGRKLFISSDKYGDNLYAFCEQDIALLLVNKMTLSDASGNILGTTGTSDSQFIKQEEWQNIGSKRGLQSMHKWTWAEDGNRVFYANKNGVFMFQEGQEKVTDISEGNRERLISDLQESFGNLFKRTLDTHRELVELQCLGYGFYDNKYSEYGFITKFPSVVVNEMIKDSEEETDNIFYDITDANNVLFEVLYNDEFSDHMYIKLLSNSPLVLSETKTFYIRKTVQQKLTVIIYEDATSGTYSVTLEQEDEYVKISRNVFAISEYENDVEWNIQVINKEILELSRNLFVYCTREKIKSWVSENDYNFDRVQVVDGKKYGFRNLKCYELETGTILNENPIEVELVDCVNPDKEDLEQDKEFTRIQINTARPIEDKDNLIIDFLKPDTDTVFSTINGSNLNKYGGYTNYINRNSETGERYQDTKILFSVKYNGKDKIAITSVDVQYKILK